MNTQDLCSLQEAYISVYETAPTSPADAVKKVNKKNFPPSKPLEESDDVREQTASDYPLTGGTNTPRSQRISDMPANCKPTRQGKDPSKPIGKGNPEAVKCEETDVFDIIKGYLIDECFAETEEAALAIMANMSEEWMQSIIEQKPPKVKVHAPSKPKDPNERNGATSRSGNNDQPDSSVSSPGYDTRRIGGYDLRRLPQFGRG